MTVAALLAEAGPTAISTDVPPWMQPATIAGLMGIMCWSLWYEKSKAEPRRQKDARDERAAHDTMIRGIIAEHNDLVKKVVDDFRGDLREERVARSDEIRALREAFEVAGCSNCEQFQPKK